MTLRPNAFAFACENRLISSLFGAGNRNARAKTPPEGMVQAVRQVRRGDHKPLQLRKLQLLHQCDDDAVQLTHLGWTSTLLPKGVDFIEQEYTSRGLGKLKQLPEVRRCLPKICPDHGVKPHDEERQVKFVRQCVSGEALSTSRRPVEDELARSRRMPSASISDWCWNSLMTSANCLLASLRNAT